MKHIVILLCTCLLGFSLVSCEDPVKSPYMVQAVVDEGVIAQDVANGDFWLVGTSLLYSQQTYMDTTGTFDWITLPEAKDRFVGIEDYARTVMTDPIDSAQIMVAIMVAYQRNYEKKMSAFEAYFRMCNFVKAYNDLSSEDTEVCFVLSNVLGLDYYEAIRRFRLKE